MKQGLPAPVTEEHSLHLYAVEVQDISGHSRVDESDGMRCHLEPGDRSEEQLGIRCWVRAHPLRNPLVVDIEFVGTGGGDGGREDTDSSSDEVELNRCILDIGCVI